MPKLLSNFKNNQIDKVTAIIHELAVLIVATVEILGKG